jgi:hypothetical protein
LSLTEERKKPEAWCALAEILEACVSSKTEHLLSSQCDKKLWSSDNYNISISFLFYKLGNIRHYQSYKFLWLGQKA